MKKQSNTSIITIVIPCYNGSAHVGRAIRSVINQTYTCWRLIVVDDGSTDNSAQVISGFGDPRIRLVQQDNQGVSAARNHGIQLAETEWVAFLDADDEWMPTFLQEVVDSAAMFPSSVAVFTDYKILPPGQAGLAHLPEGPILISDYFGFFLTHRRGMWSSCCIIKRHVLKKVGGFPIGVTHGEDIDTWARISWVGDFVCVPRALAIYHVDVPGSAMKIPLRNRLTTPRVWLSYLEWYKSGRIPVAKLQSTQRYIAYIMFWHVIDLIDVGLKHEARDMAKRIVPMSALRRWMLQVLLGFPGDSGVRLWRTVDAMRRGLGRYGVHLKMKA